MAFMVPEYTKERMWLVETSYGSEVVPADLLPKSWQREEIITLGEHSEGFDKVFDYIEGDDPSELSLIKNKWWARLSAPGYMDRTDWGGPFDTKKQAEEYIEDTYEVDPKTGEHMEYNPRRKKRGKKATKKRGKKGAKRKKKAAKKRNPISVRKLVNQALK